MFKCWTCNKSIISKGDLSPGGKQQYVVTCKLHNCTFIRDWDDSFDLPCKPFKYSNLFPISEKLGKLKVVQNFYKNY